VRTETPSDPERRFLDLSGGRVAYTDEGHGPVLIALHGCPGSVRDWRWMGSPLGSYFRFIRLELPGFGETALRSGSAASQSGRAQWVLKVLHVLGIDTFSVMGHSAGGFVALELAARYPERVTALSLVAAPGIRRHKALRAYPFARFISTALHVPFLRRVLIHRLHTGFAEAGFPSGLPDDSIRQTMHIVAKMDFGRQKTNVALLSVPTMVAWSADDRFIEATVEEEMSHLCPEGPRLEFADGGHHIQKTYSREICAALIEWHDTFMTSAAVDAGI
jgi:pimeloyl-ACP methyl ester carboxylesterase